MDLYFEQKSAQIIYTQLISPLDNEFPEISYCFIPEDNYVVIFGVQFNIRLNLSHVKACEFKIRKVFEFEIFAWMFFLMGLKLYLPFSFGV